MLSCLPQPAPAIIVLPSPDGLTWCRKQETGFFCVLEQACLSVALFRVSSVDDDLLGRRGGEGRGVREACANFPLVYLGITWRLSQVHGKMRGGVCC